MDWHDCFSCLQVKINVMINPRHLLLTISLLSLSLVTAHAQNEPYLVANLNPNGLGTEIDGIYEKDGKVYIDTDPPRFTDPGQLWISDGTSGGTERQTLFVQTSPNVSESLLIHQVVCTVKDGILLLVNDNSIGDMIIYKLNTTTGDLTPLPQLTSSLNSPYGFGVVRFNQIGALGDFQFLEVVISSQELKEVWVTDGSQFGSWKLYSSDFRATGVHAVNTFGDRFFYAVETELYSTGITPDSRELLLDYQEISNHWVSDGDGIVDDAMGEEMYYFNEKLYFNLYTPISHGRHLYVYDLNSSSLTDLTQLYGLPEAQTVFDEFRYFSRSSDFLYFQYQNLLWKLDLDSDEITSVEVVSNASVGRLLQFDEESILVSAEDQTYTLKAGDFNFLANASLVNNDISELEDSKVLPLLSASEGIELWKVSNDLSSAEIFIDANEGPADGYISNLTSTAKGFVFHGVNQSGPELWHSDGTPEGTQVFGITGGEASSGISNLVRNKDQVVFRARTEANPTEPHSLYQLDYETNDVNKIADIESIGNTFAFNNELYLYDSGIYRLDNNFQIQETIYTAKENDRFGRVRSVTVLPESFLFVSSITSGFQSDIWMSDGSKENTYPLTSISSFVSLEFISVSDQGNKMFFPSNDADGRDAIFEFDFIAEALTVMPESDEIRGIDKFGSNIIFFTNQGFKIYNDECGLYSTEFQAYSSLFYIGNRLFTFTDNQIYQVNCGALDLKHTFDGSELISSPIIAKNAAAVPTRNENTEEWAIWYFDGDRVAAQPFNRSMEVFETSIRPEQEFFTQMGSMSDLFFYWDRSQHYVSNGQPDSEQSLGNLWNPQSFPHDFIGLKNRLYFKANNGPEGEELWAVDLDGGFLEITINGQLILNGDAIDLRIFPDDQLTMTLDNSGDTPVEINSINSSGFISIDHSQTILGPGMSTDLVLELSGHEGMSVGQVSVSSNSFNYPEFSFEIRRIETNQDQQSIQIEIPDTIRYGIAPIPLAISGGLTDASTIYTSSNTDILDIVDGNIVPMDVGSSVIVARQSGDDQFLPESVAKVISVIKGIQDISFDLPDTLNVGETYVLEGTSTSGFLLGYALSQTNIASIQGRNLTLSGPGEIEIIAYQNGTGLYDRAVPVSQSAVVVGTVSGLEQPTFVNVFPVPAANHIHVHSAVGRISNIQIVDLAGRLWYKSDRIPAGGAISLENVPQGIYVLQMTLAGKRLTRRIIIQR